MNDFALLIGIGSSLGLLRVARYAPQSQARRQVLVALSLLMGSLVGARLGYVVVHSGYYALHLEESLQFWQGGLSLPGAIGGALLAFLIVAAAGHFSFLTLADAVAPLLAPLAVAAWLACWRAGCACGPVAPAGVWWAVPAVDESGVLAPHFPLQPLAALVLLLYFWILESKAALSDLPGGYGSLAALGLGLDLALFTHFVVDPAIVYGGLRVETWSALSLCILSTAGFIIACRNKRLVISKSNLAKEES